MIALAIGPNLYVTSEPATWIDSTTGQPIGDGKRGACYWRLDVVKVPDQAVRAVARTIRLEEPAPQEMIDA